MGVTWVVQNGHPRFVAINDDTIHAAVSLAALLKDPSHKGHANRCLRVDTDGRPMGASGSCAVYEIPEETYKEMQKGRPFQLKGFTGKLLDHGAWKDLTGNSGKDRLFSNKRRDVNTKTSVLACAVEAAKNGTQWFGVEGRNGLDKKECYIETDPTNIATGLLCSLLRQREGPGTQALQHLGPVWFE